MEQGTTEVGGRAVVPLVGVFGACFRIGLFTLGGGMAMLTVMRHELVKRRRWLGEDEFVAMAATATALPGPIAVNMAYQEGHRLRGAPGAAVAVLGTVLPSFMVILFIAAVIPALFERPNVAAFFRGCGIAVAGQIAFACLTFGRKLLKRRADLAPCAVALGMMVMGAHPVWAIAAAGVLGALVLGDGAADEGEAP